VPIRKRILWRLFPAFVLILLIALAAIVWYSFNLLAQFQERTVNHDLRSIGLIAADLFADRLSIENATGVDAACKSLGTKVGARITVILPDGTVIGDSEEDPPQMNNHANRDEVRLAILEGIGSSTRFSRTLRKQMVYVAVAVNDNDDLAGVVRTSKPVPELAASLRRVYGDLVLAGLAVALFSMILTFLVARWINRPLSELTAGAARFAAGDLDHRLPVPEIEEIGALAVAMNEMASELGSRIGTITRQRNELEAVLSSMVEAVIVVEPDLRIARINRAAAALFQIDAQESVCKTVLEITRNLDLDRFVSRVMESEEPQEDDLVLSGSEANERYLQVHGTRILDAGGADIGALVVLNDVTSLKRLENVRRDFVANVSHELKTPITSIQGFVETLRDGAIADRETAENFLDIISRHSDRLNAIIDDLLALSRIEQGKEHGEIALSVESVIEVIDSAVNICQTKADEKQIEVGVFCDEDLRVTMNPPLLEQAIVNLVDNAIKYSEPGCKIQILAEKTESETVIRVIDSGRGIPREHLDRIFERFYRVDKARSRKLGGTGLGLAIVKHIVNAHSGRMSVESRIGAGSTFTIHLL
jgi:two-component system, OmpR family, phosphate regulon sensor histidine kinase PhoR